MNNIGHLATLYGYKVEAQVVRPNDQYYKLTRKRYAVSFWIMKDGEDTYSVTVNVSKKNGDRYTLIKSAEYNVSGTRLENVFCAGFNACAREGGSI